MTSRIRKIPTSILQQFKAAGNGDVRLIIVRKNDVDVYFHSENDYSEWRHPHSNTSFSWGSPTRKAIERMYAYSPGRYYP